MTYAEFKNLAPGNLLHYAPSRDSMISEMLGVVLWTDAVNCRSHYCVKVQWLITDERPFCAFYDRDSLLSDDMLVVQ